MNASQPTGIWTEVFRVAVSRLARLAYRIEVEGLENVPRSGAGLLAMNHTAFSDAPIMQSVLPRALRFVMSREIYEGWKWFRPAFRANRAILIHATDRPRELARAIGSVRDALRGGDLLGLFPEGALTRSGRIEAFRPGIEHMLRGTGAPVVPVYIGNLWGSVFSHADGAPGFRLPRHLFRRRVVVRIGSPLPADSAAAEIRAAVLGLAGEGAVAWGTRRTAPSAPPLCPRPILAPPLSPTPEPLP